MMREYFFWLPSTASFIVEYGNLCDGKSVIYTVYHGPKSRHRLYKAMNATNDLYIARFCFRAKKQPILTDQKIA